MCTGISQSLPDQRIHSNCQSCTQRKLSLFDKLDFKSLEILNRNKSIVSYQAGESLFKEGNKVQGLICLQSGKIKEYKVSHSSGNELIISLKKPVDFVGLPDLLNHRIHHTSAVALEKTNICIIDQRDFMEVFQTNPMFALRVSAYLSVNIEETQNHLLHLTQNHMRGRVAYALLYLKDFFGLRLEDSFINQSLKRSDLASLTNMTTANIIRTLASFSNEKLIELNGREIRILQDSKVKQLCDLN